MSGPTQATRQTVLKRAEGKCERCGVPLDSFFYSLQHRRARGMGGSKRAETNSPANLIALCGSATTGCHGWVESHPDRATALGYRLSQSQDPSRKSVKRLDQWVFLADDGSFELVKR